MQFIGPHKSYDFARGQHINNYTLCCPQLNVVPPCMNLFVCMLHQFSLQLAEVQLNTNSLALHCFLSLLNFPPALHWGSCEVSLARRGNSERFVALC